MMMSVSFVLIKCRYSISYRWWRVK